MEVDRLDHLSRLHPSYSQGLLLLLFDKLLSVIQSWKYTFVTYKNLSRIQVINRKSSRHFVLNNIACRKGVEGFVRGRDLLFVFGSSIGNLIPYC
jgi:hypothetical protein